ncbi:MAG: hypothetical protein J5755_04795, partial [Clostridia bacterium]|nr:hypothetical protein [Clostridia bacterium]
LVTVTAAGKYQDNSDYSGTNQQLTEGQEIALSNIPTSLTLTFHFTGTEQQFFALAEADLTVTLSWTIVDEFVILDANYYIIGTMTGWNVNRTAPVCETNTANFLSGDDTDNVAVCYNVALNAGDEFKVVTHAATPTMVWYDCAGGAAENNGITVLSGGNCKVDVSGTYCIYVHRNKVDNKDVFYVGPARQVNP